MDTEKLQSELQEYNMKIHLLIQERTKFLDDNMHLYAEFKIGDVVRNALSGRKGVCVGHKRKDSGSASDNGLGCTCIIQEKPDGAEICCTHETANTHFWYKPGDAQALKEKKELIISRSRWFAQK